jgi:hypothetical protein
MIILSAGCTDSLSSPSGSVPASPVSGSPYNGSWKEYPLTDMQGKGNFSVNMFAGKPVLVSVQSVACPSCILQLIRQLEEISRVPAVQEGKIIVVSLDIDPSENAGFIASYHDRFNFTGYTAHSPTDLSVNLFHTFGPFAIDPATVPVILVCPDGRDLLLPTGVKTAENFNATLVKEC